MPHVVGNVIDYPSKPNGDPPATTSSETSDSKSVAAADSSKRPTPTAGSKSTYTPSLSSKAPDLMRKTGETNISSSTNPIRPDVSDKRQREKLKAAYMEMKKDPNTDPAKLAKLKKLLLASEGSRTSNSEPPADSTSVTKDRSAPSIEDSDQEKKDLLIAQYMKLKGDPDSDQQELKRLKAEISGLSQQKDVHPLAKGTQAQPAAIPPSNPNQEPEKVENTPVADAERDKQKQQLKALYKKLKEDPNTDPRKLEKVKMAIVGLDKSAPAPSVNPHVRRKRDDL
jgi:hypothetical protein